MLLGAHHLPSQPLYWYAMAALLRSQATLARASFCQFAARGSAAGYKGYRRVKRYERYKRAHPADNAIHKTASS